MSTKRCMLSTVDNEYDPFEEYDAWRQRDISLGHDCEAMLDSHAFTCEGLPEEINNLERELAIKEIVLNDPLHIYKMVTKV